MDFGLGMRYSFCSIQYPTFLEIVVQNSIEKCRSILTLIPWLLRMENGLCNKYTVKNRGKYWK